MTIAALVSSGNNVGTILKLAPDGSETILHSFVYSDGPSRWAGLMRLNRHLYGTTSLGGGSADCDGNGCGTVFKIKP